MNNIALNNFKRIAGDEIESAEVLSGVIYAFGSELGVLRLLAGYQKNGTVGYSENLGTWYFSLDRKY
jgi:hypothetical protein